LGGALLGHQNHTLQQHAGLTVLALASMAEAAEVLVWQPPVLQHHFWGLPGYKKVVGLHELLHWVAVAAGIS
jgi:hypothetical protein